MEQNLEKQVELHPIEESSKRKGLRFIVYGLVSAIALGTGYGGYKIYEEAAIQRAKIEYEQKHAYELTPEEVSRLSSIRKAQKASSESLFNQFFNFGYSSSEDEKEFLSKIDKRIENIIREPETAYTRFSNNDKKDFNEFSKKYDEVFKSYKEFLSEFDKIDKLHSENNKKWLENLASIPFAVFLGWQLDMRIDMVRVYINNDAKPQNTMTNAMLDGINKNLESSDEEKKIANIYFKLKERKKEVENEMSVLGDIFNRDKYKFNFEIEDKDKDDTDKLLYFFYSRANSTLLTHY